MIEMKRGHELHRKVSRGEKLSKQERADLEAWYTEMDAEEAKTLKVIEGAPPIEELRILLDSEVHALRQTVEEIEAIHTQNEALRQEIAAMKRRLAEKQPVMTP